MILDSQKRVLLVHEPDESCPGLEIWVAPGGGVEASEDPTEALGRELQEEIGVAGALIGPHVWDRHCVFRSDGRSYDQREQFYLVDINSATPATGDRLWRWWSLEDLLQRSPGVTFYPSQLAALLPPLMEGRIPQHPFDAGD